MNEFPRFEIRKTRTKLLLKRYHVVLVGEKGEVLMSSETLNTKRAARENAASVIVNAPRSSVIDLT